MKSHPFICMNDRNSHLHALPLPLCKEIMFGMEEDFFESASSESMRVYLFTFPGVHTEWIVDIITSQGKNKRNNQLDSGWEM